MEAEGQRKLEGKLNGAATFHEHQDIVCVVPVVILRYREFDGSERLANRQFNKTDVVGGDYAGVLLCLSIKLFSPLQCVGVPHEELSDL